MRQHYWLGLFWVLAEAMNRQQAGLVVVVVVRGNHLCEHHHRSRRLSIRGRDSVRCEMVV